MLRKSIDILQCRGYCNQIIRRDNRSRVRYNFIQIGMNLALFIPKNFIQNHFQKTTFTPKQLSSKTTLIPNHFHPKQLSSHTTYIQNQTHPMTTIIQNQFHPMTTFIPYQQHQQTTKQQPTTNTHPDRHTLKPQSSQNHFHPLLGPTLGSPLGPTPGPPPPGPPPPRPPQPRTAPTPDHPHPDRPSRTTPPPDHPSAGPPLRWTAQNFALFFPLPPQNSFFSSLSGGLLVEFWWCFKGPDPQMCTFGVLGLLCEAPLQNGRASHDRREDSCGGGSGGRGSG